MSQDMPDGKYPIQYFIGDVRDYGRLKRAMEIAGKNQSINHIPGLLGVRGRNSENSLIKEKLGWEPNYPLNKGLEITYKWIAEQVENAKKEQ